MTPHLQMATFITQNTRIRISSSKKVLHICDILLLGKYRPQNITNVRFSMIQRSHINFEIWLKYGYIWKLYWRCDFNVETTLRFQHWYNFDLRLKLGWNKVVVSMLIQLWNVVEMRLLFQPWIDLVVKPLW